MTQSRPVDSATLIVGKGDHAYLWHGDWALGAYPNGDTNGWAHHGVAVSGSKDVVAYHPAHDLLLVYDLAGTLVRSWSPGLVEAHGITCVEEDGVGYVWIADPGVKLERTDRGPYEPSWSHDGGQVAKFRLEDG